MKPVTLVLVAILLTIGVFAATYTDTADADFNLGNNSTVNVTGNAVVLPFVGAGVYNTSGIFYSQVFDLGSNPSASISWNYATAAGNSLLISTRSGNNTVAGSTGWSGWSSDYGTSSGSTVTSAHARYYQYRAQLTTTDNTTSPSLTDVTLTYTEANVSITRDSTLTGNATGSTTGNFIYYVNVSDSFTVQNVSARYRLFVGSTAGSYSSFTPLSISSGTSYNYTIPEPGSGWDSYTNYTANGTIDIDIYVNVTNGSTTFAHNASLQETIEFVNTAPTIDPVTNVTVAQSATMNFTVSGGDTDNQSIVFTTNNSLITVTTLTNTSARLTWTPNGSHVGLHTVILYANDTLTTNSTTFTVNVTDANDAPEIEAVDDITGYHGVRQSLILVATDIDSDADLTFSMDPDFFDINTSTSYPNGTAAASYTYLGLANFTPADEEDGTHNVTFFVTDGEETANVTATMTIDYCGDLTCQTDYENESTCNTDCQEEQINDAVALILPDRNCVNEEIIAYTYNASDRINCYYQGLVDRERGLALCVPIDGADVTVYYRNGSLLTEEASVSSDQEGAISFTPEAAGEYKFSVSAESFANTSALVYVRDCTSEIVVIEQNQTVTQPALPPIEEDEETPQEEEPGVPQEQASLLTILVFYFLVPVLLASLIYTSFVFYDVNKDTLPWLLEIRIFFYEQRKKYLPTLQKGWQKISPYLIPVFDAMEELYVTAIKPLLQPLLDKLKKR